MDGIINIRSLFPHLHEFHCIEISVLDILSKDKKGFPTEFNKKFLIIGKDGSIELSDKRISQEEWLHENWEKYQRNFKFD